ncbi:hypothetical protein DYU11_03670 [Fibrisoma montanum]|uniref:Outer membrane protein beta-barrel domain-containing protein n=1 Tax=Fibrisoma montanum TaxID=2305895 RepID=A0A418MIX0_9BACT|nr:hypothetical protein [Fibrisoma montanum]RIV27415.1 hypothetical protein DYU11_03670 [Fibrisoma montanum]
MKKYYSILIAFLLLVSFRVQAQDSLQTFKSRSFRSIELKTGIGFGYPPQLYKIPINVVYQQNLKGGFSAIIYSEILHQSFSVPKLNYNASEFLFLQSLGIGRTIGNGRFNHGLYVLGGGRVYRTTLTLDESDFNQKSLVTRTVSPELGLMYNLKVGRKRFYYSTQLYFVLTPLKNFIEARHSLMMGVGYRLNSRK